MNIVAIIIGAIFLALSWRWPRLALWLILFSIPFYVIRFEIAGIPTTLLELFIYGSWLAWAFTHHRTLLSSIKETYRPIWGGLLFLGIGLFLGVVVSDDMRASLGIVKGWFFDPLLLYFLVIQILKKKDFATYLFAPIASSLLISSYAIWQVITQNFLTIDGRVSAWFTSANYLSLYLVPILILGLIVFSDKNIYKKIITGVAWGLGLIALYFSFSYGGWLTIIIAALAWALIYRQKLWKWWLSFLGIPIVLFLSQLGSERFVRMLDFSQRSSVSVRFQVWRTALLMIKEHWETGIGLGQFQSQYLGFAKRLFSPPFETIMLHSHNLYLQFLIETGIWGLIGFVWILIFHIRRLLSNFWGPAGILMIALASMLIHGLVDVSYWKNDLAVLFWLILGLIVVWSRKEEEYER